MRATGAALGTGDESAALQSQSARSSGCPQRSSPRSAHAAAFHDIGKAAIPDEILLKPARLSASEWSLMQRHSAEGARMIASVRALKSAVPAILHHHERYDGTGYPDGLSGQEIPLGARIVHLADAVDSMLSNRVYRPGRPGTTRAGRGPPQAGKPVLSALRAGPRTARCCRQARRHGPSRQRTLLVRYAGTTVNRRSPSAGACAESDAWAPLSCV